MATITVTTFLSLDGVMENPAWTAPYWNDDIAAFKADETTPCTAMLLGRVTYQAFAAAWPTSTDEGAAVFNPMRKYVASTTLTEHRVERHPAHRPRAPGRRRAQANARAASSSCTAAPPSCAR